MKYKDLRDFIAQLERDGELRRITAEVDPYLEMTEICDRTLKRGGPALLFENPKGYDMPVLGNLFGTPERVARAMGAESVAALRDVGELLAFLKEPEPPKGMRASLAGSWAKIDEEMYESCTKPAVLGATRAVVRWWATARCARRALRRGARAA